MFKILKLVVSTVSLLFLLSSTNTFAKSTENAEGLFGLVDLSLGYASVSENEPLTLDKSGVHFHSNFGGSYYTKDIILDLTAGWFFNNISSDNYKVRTTGINISGELRYRINQSFSVGPNLMALLGTDNTFSNIESDDANSYFLGIALNYETTVKKDKKLRYYASLQKDLNIKDRDAYLSNIGIQFAFPWVKKSKETKVSLVKRRPRRKIKIISTGMKSMKAILDSETGLLFDSGKSDTNPEMEASLKKFSRFLKLNNDQFDRIVISGHTDIIGGMKQNIRLSRNRAKAVSKILINNGSDSKKMRIKAYGPKKLLFLGNTSLAHRKNRRVEIEFFNIFNKEKFLNAYNATK